MEVVQQILAILLVFGLLALTLWKLRAGGGALPSWNRGRAKGSSLERVERMVLTAQHTMHVVRVNGRELVVVTHPRGCSVLGDPRPREDA